MFDLVIFDLDGTLVDTAPEITDAVNTLLGAHRLAPVSETLVRAWIGRGTRELLAQAVAHATHSEPEEIGARGDIERLMPEFARIYLAASGTRSKPYPAVEHTLDELRALGVRLAMATNKEERFAFAVLDRHRLHDYLDLIVCGDTLEAKKPDPLPIAYCVQRLGTTPARTLLVGDSEIDVATARNAGVAVWAVPYGYNHGRPILETRPDRVIPTVADVARCIAQHRAQQRDPSSSPAY